MLNSRRTGIGLLALAAAVVSLAFCRVGTASSAQTFMSCGFPPTLGYGIESDGQISYRRHPARCYYSDDGSTARLVNLVGIQWDGWGEPRATARAKQVDNHDMDNNGFQRHLVRIVVSRLLPAVGHNGTNKVYYTRLRVIDSDGHSGTLRLFRPGQDPIRLPEY
jgi:hypothetical protein